MRDITQIQDTIDDLEDRELQLAFEKGILKPGLHEQVTTKAYVHINDIDGLKSKLKEIKLNLPWVQTLELVCEPAPLAPELAMQLEAQKNKTELESNEKEDDLIYDDFAREMTFYRLAQAAVLKGLPQLHRLGVPTKRPNDYFAEMAKGDDHMHKVREQIQFKQTVMVRRERARKMRELKRYGKIVQIEKLLKRHKEKRTFLGELKKYKKGKTDNLDFLEDGPPKKVDTHGIRKSKKDFKKDLSHPRGEDKKKSKEQKYGKGGKQKGWKRNTAADLDGPVDSSGHSIGRMPRKAKHQQKAKKFGGGSSFKQGKKGPTKGK